MLRTSDELPHPARPFPSTVCRCTATTHADEDATSPLVLDMKLETNDGTTAIPSVDWTIGEDFDLGRTGLPVLPGPYTLTFNDPSCTEAITFDVGDPACTFPVCSVSSLRVVNSRPRHRINRHHRRTFFLSRTLTSDRRKFHVADCVEHVFFLCWCCLGFAFVCNIGYLVLLHTNEPFSHLCRKMKLRLPNIPVSR